MKLFLNDIVRSTHLNPSRRRLVALQSPQERGQAEQVLKPFGLSPEYVAHCKVNMRFTLTFAS